MENVQERMPTAVALNVYGNNSSVACPCGKILVVRSLGNQGSGQRRCACGRGYKGYPEGGKAIEGILAWESENNSKIPTYRVRAICD